MRTVSRNYPFQLPSAQPSPQGKPQVLLGTHTAFQSKALRRCKRFSSTAKRIRSESHGVAVTRREAFNADLSLIERGNAAAWLDKSTPLSLGYGFSRLS